MTVFGKAELQGGELKVVKSTTVSQAKMSSGRWFVQAWGLERCNTCEYKGRRDCGGKKIRKTGMNEFGFSVPLGN
jgi:hypothetical protein